MKEHVANWCRRHPRKTAALVAAGVFAASTGAAYLVGNVIMPIQGKFEDYSLTYNVVRSLGSLTAYFGTGLLGLKAGINLGKRIYLPNNI